MLQMLFVNDLFIHSADGLLLLQVHRWGSALPAKPFGSPCLTAESALLAACGDFCLGAGVENAVLSGKAAAEAMTNLLGQNL